MPILIKPKKKNKQKTITVKGENITTSTSGKSTSTSVRNRKADSKTDNLSVDARLKKEGAYSASDSGKTQMMKMKAESDRKKKLRDDKKGPKSGGKNLRIKNYGGVMPYKKKK